jgi:hypothetical protein
MASAIFEQESGLRFDECALRVREAQNASMSDYMLFNAYATNVTPCASQNSKLHEFVATNRNLRFKDGAGFASACVVDSDSKLRNEVEWTHPRGRQQLGKRWYQAGPALSHGGLVPNVESRLRLGDDTTFLRQCDRLTEKDFDRFTPMLPCLKKEVQNPEHIVPSKWTHGGEWTRNEFVEGHGCLSST